MITLILKKQSKGYYTNQIGNIRIEVSQCNKQWSGFITDESKVTEGYQLYNCYGNTKKDVVMQLINFIKK